MAYFLKKAALNNRTFLSIVESFYSASKKGTAHQTYKSLGSIETAIKNGIEDPVSYYQEEVDKLNHDMADKKEIKIGTVSPIKYLGYFPLQSIMQTMGIQKYINYYKLTTDYQFDLYELLSSLIVT